MVLAKTATVDSAAELLPEGLGVGVKGERRETKRVPRNARAPNFEEAQSTQAGIVGQFRHEFPWAGVLNKGHEPPRTPTRYVDFAR